jgi:hypothetical protein
MAKKQYTYADRFEGLSSEQLKEMASEITSYAKEVAAKEAQERAKQVAESLRINGTAYFIDPSGKAQSGTVKRLTETSATVELKDGTRKNKQYSKLYLENPKN